jgi:hypothetical protein
MPEEKKGVACCVLHGIALVDLGRNGQALTG